MLNLFSQKQKGFLRDLTDVGNSCEFLSLFF